MNEFTDITVSCKNPEALDQTIQQLGPAAAIDGSFDGSTYEETNLEIDALKERIKDLEDLLEFLRRQGVDDEDGDRRWSFCLSKHHLSMEDALRSWQSCDKRISK